MERVRKESRLAVYLSYVYILAALCLLLTVCGRCYPAAGQWLRETVAGMENNPVREAFSVLAQGLEEGKSVKEALTESVAVFGEAEA